MNFFLLLSCIIIMFVSVCKCQNDPTELLRMTSQRYCGENLSKTLSTVCRGKYNTLSKRWDVMEKRDYWSPTYNTEKEEPGYPLMRKSRAVSMIGNHQRRKRRGVYNECCEKACSYKELSSYCAP